MDFALNPRMSMSILLSAGFRGIEAVPINVEVDISEGTLPCWNTVGLAENAVRESKDRVIAAVNNSGYYFPFKRITINLAPADLKKSGTAYDLPIALGLLGASEIIPQEKLQETLFLGELSLTGELRPIRGALSAAILAKQRNLKTLILPTANVWEAQAITGVKILGAKDLPQVVEYLLDRGELSQAEDLASPSLNTQESPKLDFSEVQGQSHAKRALEISASGFHHLLMSGPPGTGKSMLAQRLPSILPPLDFEASLTTSQIYSLMGHLKPGQGLITTPPFRSPHHTISDAGLIGGGQSPRPGEISLAHHGVLFLDELPEFRRHVLESLRQPLESHEVTIARALESLTYPAQFLLIAAMNPCPCGQLGHPKLNCRCDEFMQRRYRAKLSGPLLDRIDLQVQISPISFQDLQTKTTQENSTTIRSRVEQAHQKQSTRFKNSALRFNGEMGPREIQEYCILDSEGQRLLEKVVEKWSWSARTAHRMLKVARTIADLESSESIQLPHLREAMSYRMLER